MERQVSLNTKSARKTQIRSDIKGKVLKLGDPRIPKTSNGFYDLTFNHIPKKVYITQEHFDYLVDDFDQETYEIFGHIGHRNKFTLFFFEEDGKKFHIFTEIVIKG